MKYIALGFAFSSGLRLTGLQGWQYWGVVGCGIGLLAAWELIGWIEKRGTHEQ